MTSEELKNAKYILSEYRADRMTRRTIPRATAVELATLVIDARGEVPTPAKIVEELNDVAQRQGGGVSLNGRDSAVRNATLRSLGYTQKRSLAGARWVRP